MCLHSLRLEFSSGYNRFWFKQRIDVLAKMYIKTCAVKLKLVIEYTVCPPGSRRSSGWRPCGAPTKYTTSGTPTPVR